MILKLVSRSDVPVRAEIALSGVGDIAPNASCTVISGDLMDENLYSFWNSHLTTPRTEALEVAPQFSYEIPAHSLSVIRMKTRNSAQ